MYSNDVLQDIASDIFTYPTPSITYSWSPSGGSGRHLAPENQRHAEKEAWRGEAWRDAFTRIIREILTLNPKVDTFRSTCARRETQPYAAL